MKSNIEHLKANEDIEGLITAIANKNKKLARKAALKLWVPYLIAILLFIGLLGWLAVSEYKISSNIDAILLVYVPIQD